MRKRMSSAALALVMAVSLLAATALPAGAVSYAGGSGTKDDPYLIASAQQLANFRDAVNAGDEDLCASLIANVDMAGQEWAPIGLSARGYNGTFDGNGYAIRNLVIDRFSSGTSTGGSILWGGGLFGIVGKSGVVRGVNVDGQVAVTEGLSNNVDIGGIAGGNLGLIEECFVTVSIRDNLTILSPTSSSYTTLGGIAGVNNGTIRNCYVVGDMQFALETNQACIGGLVGKQYSGATLQKCYAAVSIKVTTDASLEMGALVGRVAGSGLSQLYANSDLTAALWGSGSSSGGTALTTSQMKTAAFAAQLGSAFSADTAMVNQGYPILQAMVYDEESDWSQWFEDEAMGDNINQEVFDSLIPPELQNRNLTYRINRVEFCAVAVRLYEQMGGTQLSADTLSSPFTDTSSDAVKKAYAIGITNGTSATTFDPYVDISREQLATMLTRVYKALNFSGWTLNRDGQYTLDYSGTKTFADDGAISAYAKPSVYFMVKNEIIKGTSATTFSPKHLSSMDEAVGYATREQALIMAVRMHDKL